VVVVEKPAAAPAVARPATPRWVWLVVGSLLVVHYALAAHSLLAENPTVDEVVHLPAGITYWQKGTFRLYHHNPPLIKLVAALPALLAGPETEPLYQSQSWRSADPSPTTFSQLFAALNVPRYFELFRLARLTMPFFSLVGALAVFAWSRRLYGDWGGLLSLSLWVFCPNILAHARLVTTDVGSASIGFAATYLFWSYLRNPTWRGASLAGVALGLAQLTKFSMILLYAVWPFLWLIRLWLVAPRAKWPGRVARGVVQGFAMVVLSVVMIDVGYFFEGVGIPLGRYEFGSRSLTRPVTGDELRPRSKNPLFDAAWQFRVNRFRGTWLEGLPAPLPEHFLLGFDEQKIETEGVPRRFFEAIGKGTVVEERTIPEQSGEPRDAYPVYLNGVLRRTGWWYYYLLSLVYKVPEGTWALVLLSLGVLVFFGRSREAWADEIALATVPPVVLFSMSFLTDINLGLRYVLAIAPYVFVAVGKVVPWAMRLGARWRQLAVGYIGICMAGTLVSCLWIHPHYLAYFNWSSGGPDRTPARLIDSNLDWGQDLEPLERWCERNIPGQTIGLAYFGQINPSLFRMRGRQFSWFLPPGRPGTIVSMGATPGLSLIGPARTLTPGYYAISVSLVYGLPWRLYDPADPLTVPAAWAPAWNAYKDDAFSYFQAFEPIHRIGHSIDIYHLNEADVARVRPQLEGPR
jgi:hypothetical protein